MGKADRWWENGDPQAGLSRKIAAYLNSPSRSRLKRSQISELERDAVRRSLGRSDGCFLAAMLFRGSYASSTYLRACAI
jgi:hypothetical protein